MLNTDCDRSPQKKQSRQPNRYETERKPANKTSTIPGNANVLSEDVVGAALAVVAEAALTDDLEIHNRLHPGEDLPSADHHLDEKLTPISHKVEVEAGLMVAADLLSDLLPARLHAGDPITRHHRHGQGLAQDQSHLFAGEILVVQLGKILALQPVQSHQAHHHPEDRDQLGPLPTAVAEHLHESVSGDMHHHDRDRVMDVGAELETPTDEDHQLTGPMIAKHTVLTLSGADQTAMIPA
jgi:hypothetical protein